MDNLQNIKSLKGVKLFYCYVITKGYYHLLKPTLGNRGGLENRRVQYYANLIKTGKFDHDLSLIQVDKNGNIIEGHHRYEALVVSEKDIVIRIVPPKELSEISNFHSGINPKWRVEQSFNASITANSEVSKMLRDLRIELCTKYKVSVKKVSACEMYGILVRNTKYFSSGKNAPTVEMWLGDGLMNIAKKREFKQNLTNYVRMKYELRSIRDAYKVSKAIMDLHFSNEIDLGIFVDAVVYDGFILDKYDVPAIKAKAMSMYQKQLKIRKAA